MWETREGTLKQGRNILPCFCYVKRARTALLTRDMRSCWLYKVCVYVCVDGGRERERGTDREREAAKCVYTCRNKRNTKACGGKTVMLTSYTSDRVSNRR